jgi:hypothetical protein
MSSITLSLPPDIEDRLRAHAVATGKDIRTVILEAVEARLALLQMNLREILAPIHADFKRSGMSDAELDALLQGTLDAARAERKKSPNDRSA